MKKRTILFSGFLFTLHLTSQTVCENTPKICMIADEIHKIIDEKKDASDILIPRNLLMGLLEVLDSETTDELNDIKAAMETELARPFSPNPTRFNDVYVQNQLMVNGPITTKNKMYVSEDFYAGKKGQMCFSSKNNALGLGTHKPTEMLDVRGNAKIEKKLTVSSLDSGIVKSDNGLLKSCQTLGYYDFADNSVGTFQLLDRCVTPDKLSADLINLITSPAEEKLKIVRGAVNANGTILSGKGFTVTLQSEGEYIIDFEYSFQGTNDYIVLATPETTDYRRIYVFNNSPNRALVQIRANDFGISVNQKFNFIAIGV